jgi:parvulin-like peptidyl-prolyl isomerase
MIRSSLAAIWCASVLSAAEPAPPLATVNGQPISTAEVKEMALRNSHNVAKPEGFAAALQDAVNFELLAAEAEARGLAADPEVRKAIKTLLVQKLLQRASDPQTAATAALPTPHVTQDELQAAYDKNKADFTQPTLVKGQILFLPAVKGKDEELRTKLAAIKADITAKLPFGNLVAKHSNNPAAQSNGGQTGWLTEGQENKQYPQPVLTALFAAKQKEGITGPLTTPQGTYYFVLNDRREGKILSLPEVRRTIEERLLREKSRLGYDSYVASLSSKSEIVRDQAALTAAQAAFAAEAGGPPSGPVTVKATSSAAK